MRQVVGRVFQGHHKLYALEQNERETAKNRCSMAAFSDDVRNRRREEKLCRKRSANFGKALEKDSNRCLGVT